MVELAAERVREGVREVAAHLTVLCVCVCVCVRERERWGDGRLVTHCRRRWARNARPCRWAKREAVPMGEARGRADGRGINHTPEAVPKAAVPRQSLRPPLRPCKI